MFAEFPRLIDSSYLSFCRGNIPCALFVLIPVIEGMLRRWITSTNQKIPKKGMYEWMVNFLHSTVSRKLCQPPIVTSVINSMVYACSELLKNHFFVNFNNGTYYDDFNRHLISHQLKLTDYRSADKVKRCYLLIDLIIEIFIYEKGGPYSMYFDVNDNDQRLQVFVSAIRSRNGETPEYILDNLYK